MTEALTPELEATFVNYFGSPRVFPLGKDHRPAARALLEALKRISAPLGLRIDVENLDAALPLKYPRIHGWLPTARKPILWSLCGPSNDPLRKVAHYKLEVLPGQTAFLKEQRIFSEVEQIANSVNVRLTSSRPAGKLKIGITPAITTVLADSIADAVVRIAGVVRPFYM